MRSLGVKMFSNKPSPTCSFDRCPRKPLIQRLKISTNTGQKFSCFSLLKRVINKDLLVGFGDLPGKEEGASDR